MTTRVRNGLLGLASLVLGAAMIGIICLDPDGILAPGIFGPLAIDVTICFAIGVLSNRAVWRFLAWPITPVAVAYLSSAPYLGQSGEAGGWAGLAYIYLLITGVVASGLACIAGYYGRLGIRERLSANHP